MKTTEETKSAEPTPEQLLKLLDVQMGESRQCRAKLESNRRTIQTVSLVAIVVGGAVLLWVLTFLLDDMRPERKRGAKDASEQGMRAELR